MATLDAHYSPFYHACMDNVAEHVEAFETRALATITPPPPDYLMAEMRITYLMRLERYAETREHSHMCMECGAQAVCYDECETSADFFGRDMPFCWADI